MRDAAWARFYAVMGKGKGKAGERGSFSFPDLGAPHDVVDAAAVVDHFATVEAERRAGARAQFLDATMEATASARLGRVKRELLVDRRCSTSPGWSGGCGEARPSRSSRGSRSSAPARAASRCPARALRVRVPGAAGGALRRAPPRRRFQEALGWPGRRAGVLPLPYLQQGHGESSRHLLWKGVPNLSLLPQFLQFLWLVLVLFLVFNSFAYPAWTL